LEKTSDVIRTTWGSFIHLFVNILALVSLALLARRNLRLKRSDPRTAFRLGLYIFSLVMPHWLFGAHHVADSAEVDLFFGALYLASFTFGLVWVFYIALEPYVRRLWPEMMVSWMRLMEGRLRDPLLGRHVLMGCLLGALWPYLTSRLLIIAGAGLGWPAPRPASGMAPLQLDVLGGLGYGVSELFLLNLNSLKTFLVWFTALFLLRLLLRRTWLAVSVFVLLACFVYGPLGSINAVLQAVAFSLWAFFLLSLRMGLRHHCPVRVERAPCFPLDV
jgi:hypothetical protein